MGLNSNAFSHKSQNKLRFEVMIIPKNKPVFSTRWIFALSLAFLAIALSACALKGSEVSAGGVVFSADTGDNVDIFKIDDETGEPVNVSERYGFVNAGRVLEGSCVRRMGGRGGDECGAEFHQAVRAAI